jgi:23S rRNA (uracil1939-C5)-methyltransferase
MNQAIASVTPRCRHFGTCGGCQLQDVPHEEQLRMKRSRLESLLRETGCQHPDQIAVHAAEPYEYRNRIRLRVERISGELRLGYNVRATTEFLPIVECPISAPLLFQTAETLLALDRHDQDAARWLNTTSEIEFFCNDASSRVQVTLLCAPRTKALPGSLHRMLLALQQKVPQVVGLGAVAFDPRTGPTGRTLDEAGATGLNYRVRDETYWISRGGFFQVNRFLLDELVTLVCEHQGKPRGGEIAWDLFSGVGLFSRVLARNFAQVTAVEANPTAVADLRSAFRKLGDAHRVVQTTALDFLEAAMLQRERPGLVVLDPPRAGAGLAVCELLRRLAPSHIVYVSCEPTTLARDLAVLQQDYRAVALHLVDLFPQTSHLETVAIFERNS